MADMAEHTATRKQFMSKALANLRGRGLIVREINMTNFQKSLGKKADRLQQHLQAGSPGLKSAAEMVVEFKRLRAAGLLSGLCSTARPQNRQEGLSRNFVNQALAKGPDDVGLRTDTVVVIAYALQRSGQRWEWQPVGVAAYGTADTTNTEDQEVTFATASLQTAVVEENIVEIDFLCAKGADALPRNGAGPSTSAARRAAAAPPPNAAPPGTGSALLAYCLARAAMRKRRGGYRYRGALLMTAADPQTSAMGAVARRMGFQRVSATIADGGVNTKYYALHSAGNAHGWVTTADASLAKLPLICERGTKCQ